MTICRNCNEPIKFVVDEDKDDWMPRYKAVNLDGTAHHEVCREKQREMRARKDDEL